jgi:glycopeptide antibiotics resistance protein
LNKKVWLALLGAMFVIGWTVALWPRSNEVRLVYSPVISALTELGLVSSDQFGVAMAILEVTLNVIVFIPFSCVLYLGIKRFRLLASLGLPLVLSVAGELAQARFLSDRVATVNDVFANFLGAVIGVGLAMLIEKLNSRRRERKRRL